MEESSEINHELFDKIKERIIYELDYWNIDYKPEDINLESNLYGIGLDRSDILTICCEFEDKFNISMPIEQIEALETISDLYKYFNKSEK